MNKTYVAALAVLMLGAPMAFAHLPSGIPKLTCEDSSVWEVHDYGPPATGLAVFLLTDGNLADCGSGVPFEFDGHSEYALGGAWLLYESGDGVASGSVACYGEPGHHFNPIFVRDTVFADTVSFRVESDYVSVVPPTDPADPLCGDFQTDETITCVDSCTPTFPPGLDGAYIVYVGALPDGLPGTLGHVSTSAPAPAL